MKIRCYLSCFPLFLAVSSTLYGGGLASNEDFLVQAPSRALADQVLEQATQFRGAIARDWLGWELPSGQGKTMIDVALSETERYGLFKPMTQPKGTLHMLWLVGTADEVTGAWLQQMTVHATLTAVYPNQLAPWVLAGVAGQYGDAAIQTERRQLLHWFAKTGRWPDLGNLLAEDHLDETDRAGLAAAASLTEFLLVRGDRPAFVQFALVGTKGNWTAALSRDYGIREITELQRQWQAWVVADLDKHPVPAGEFASVRYRIPQHNAAVASDENFTVYAKDRQMCLDILATANAMRDRIAREWLGEALPPGVGHSIVRAVLTPDEDRAKTLYQDPATRVSHMVWISTSPDRFEYALAHEITHTILATRFASELPIWAHEGAASEQDDPQLHALRATTIGNFERTGDWPRLEGLLAAPSLPHTDRDGYAIAASLTAFLVGRGGNTKFLEFAVDGQKNGWDAALRRHYSISNTAALSAQWKQYATETITAAGLKPSLEYRIGANRR